MQDGRELACSRAGFQGQRFHVLGLLCFRRLKANVVVPTLRPARICCVDFINIHIHKMCKQAFQAYEILTSGTGLEFSCSSLITLLFKPMETSFQ